MKILFLDHDGVICLRKQWGSRFSKKSKKVGNKFDHFCPKAISVLNDIIKATDCEIVVSSDWRTKCSLQEMQELYIDRGILKVPIDYTRVASDTEPAIWEETKEYKDFYALAARVRETEINDFLKKHNKNIISWVAVDDLNMNRLDSFVLAPNETEGIKQTGLKDKIIAALNKITT
tara:strand:+ start:212 stop:739 length:528 start_codon:yes stop_codon:yes gene_type:complete